MLQGLTRFLLDRLAQDWRSIPPHSLAFEQVSKAVSSSLHLLTSIDLVNCCHNFDSLHELPERAHPSWIYICHRTFVPAASMLSYTHVHSLANNSRKSSPETLEFLGAHFHKFSRRVLKGKRRVGDGVADARDTSHLRQEKQFIASRQSLF